MNKYERAPSYHNFRFRKCIMSWDNFRMYLQVVTGDTNRTNCLLIVDSYSCKRIQVVYIYLHLDSHKLYIVIDSELVKLFISSSMTHVHFKPLPFFSVLFKDHRDV